MIRQLPTEAVEATMGSGVPMMSASGWKGENFLPVVIRSPQPEGTIPKALERRESVEKHTDYRATFVVLATAALAFSLLQSLILPAIPLLEHTLDTTTTGATWLLTGYLLSAAIATPILGRIGDMVGKEKMLVVVLVAMSTGTLISALATVFPVMLAG